MIGCTHTRGRYTPHNIAPQLPCLCHGGQQRGALATLCLVRCAASHPTRGAVARNTNTGQHTAAGGRLPAAGHPALSFHRGLDSSSWLVPGCAWHGQLGGGNTQQSVTMPEAATSGRAREQGVGIRPGAHPPLGPPPQPPVTLLAPSACHTATRHPAKETQHGHTQVGESVHT
jgi:hypothetical protein